MADNEKEAEGTTPRGADWEVVTLTASAYAAAPGPGGTSKPAESKDQDVGKNERGSSSSLLMSDHFVFPPSEHENLPIESEFDEIQSEKEGKEVSSGMEDNGIKNLKGKIDVDSHEIQFIDQGKRLSVHDLEVRDDPKFEPLHVEDKGHGVVGDDGNDDGDELSHGKSNTPLEPGEDENFESGFPSKHWWKKHASCLYRRAKETNALWSVVVAAALVGLVILGHRWHREKLHLHQLKGSSCSAVRG